MGMTIDEIIKTFDYIKHVGNGESEYKHCRQEIALDTAIETMRKYQKIQEIVEHWACCGNPSDSMIAISEVVENGNDD